MTIIRPNKSYVHQGILTKVCDRCGTAIPRNCKRLLCGPCRDFVLTVVEDFKECYMPNTLQQMTIFASMLGLPEEKAQPLCDEAVKDLLELERARRLILHGG